MMSRSSSARHLVTTHTSDDEEEVTHTQEEEAGGTEAQQLDLAEYNFGENNNRLSLFSYFLPRAPGGAHPGRLQRAALPQLQEE